MQPANLLRVCQHLDMLDVDVADAPLAPAAYTAIGSLSLADLLQSAVCARRISVSSSWLAKSRQIAQSSGPSGCGDSQLAPATMMSGKQTSKLESIGAAEDSRAPQIGGWSAACPDAACTMSLETSSWPSRLEIPTPACPRNGQCATEPCAILILVNCVSRSGRCCPSGAALPSRRLPRQQ